MKTLKQLGKTCLFCTAIFAAQTPIYAQCLDEQAELEHSLDEQMVEMLQKGPKYFNGYLEARKAKEGEVPLNFSGASLAGVDLSGYDLEGADFFEADLRGAVFRGANLKDANLAGADIGEFTVLDANGNDKPIVADFTDANLNGALLCGADLTGAFIREVDLRGASLEGASLIGVNLRNSDLRGADITEADFEGTTFYNTIVVGLDFDDSDTDMEAAPQDFGPQEFNVIDKQGDLDSNPGHPMLKKYRDAEK